MIAPGGRIIGGFGGRVYVNPLGTDQSAGKYFDVADWQVQSIYHNAECTHSGTFGAITRRLVAYDFRFSATVPYDYDHPPEQLLNDAQSVAVRFNLGDVTEDPMAKEAGLVASDQKYYFAPSALIDVASTTCRPGGDVIRQQIQGSGNSVIFLCPEELTAANEYLRKLSARGWNT